jgi:predicted solute-binding protein
LRKPSVCAVSFLNTVPLAHGMAQGPQRDLVDLTFAVPSVCAERVGSGVADVGLVPVIEMDRQGLTAVPGLGIASRGAVRSILLVSRVPFHRVRTLAADMNSRTSVMLARIILSRCFRVEPEVTPMPANLDSMLARADAALLIGDAALAVDPEQVGLPCLDLGEAWFDLTGLPFVFAMWAGPKSQITPELARILRDSLSCGLGALDSIIKEESARRTMPCAMVDHYLRHNIVFQHGDAECAGLALYLKYAHELDDLVLAEDPLHGDLKA